jgi:MFS family permease
MAINFIIAILPAFQAALILNYTQTELIAAVFFVSYSFSTLTSGLLGLKHSKKWLVVAGQILAFLSLLILTKYENYILLLLIQLLFGLGCGTYHSPGTTILVDFSPKERVNTYLGIHGFASSLGMIISPLIVSFFLLSYGLKNLIFFFAFLTFAVAVIYSVMIQSDVPAKMSIKDFFSYFRESASRALILSYFLRDASFWGIMSFIPLYAFNVVGLSKASSAAVVALFPFMGLFANVAGGFLGDKFGAVRVSIFSIFLASLSLLPIILFPSSGVFYLTVIVLGVLLYATIPLYDSIVAMHMPLHFRSPAYGVFQGMGFFFGGLFSLGAGVISDYIDVKFFFVFLMVALLLSALLMKWMDDIGNDSW